MVLSRAISNRGVESRTQGSRSRTQKIFEAQAKDRPSRGQRHRRKRSPKKKKVFKNFFSGDLYLRKPKKRSLQIFHKVSGVFQRNFNGSKIVLSSSRGQGNFRGLEASMPRPRTSKCVLEAKNVLERRTQVLNVPYRTAIVVCHLLYFICSYWEI